MLLANEINPLVPHPIEIALALHVLMALVVLVAATVLAVLRRMPVFPTYVGAVLAAIFLPLVGPIVGLALVIACLVRPRPAPAQAAPCPTCGHA